MRAQEAVVKRIIELCSDRKISYNHLAYISAVPPSTVKNILNGSSNNTGIVTIAKLCNGLGITVTEFFETENFRELEQKIM